MHKEVNGRTPTIPDLDTKRMAERRLCNSLVLNSREDSRSASTAFHSLLELHVAATGLDLLPRRDLESMHLLLAPLSPAKNTSRSIALSDLIQRLDVRRVRCIAAPTRANLVELVVAPEEDVVAPVSVIVGEGPGAGRVRSYSDVGDVTHDGGGV